MNIFFQVTAGRTAQSVSDHTDVNKEPSFQKNKGEEGESGGEEAFGNANIKQLIQQVSDRNMGNFHLLTL